MRVSPWKRIKSLEVFKHPRITLVEDTVELPDGTITTYIRHAAKETQSVAIIAINDRQEMLLQQEYSYPTGEILWQLPGGESFVGESLVDAANRELSEESGLVGQDCSELGWYYLDNRRSNAKQHVILCKDLIEKQGQRDAEEFIETHWISIEEVKRMVVSGECNSAPLLAALHVYFSRS